MTEIQEEFTSPKQTTYMFDASDDEFKCPEDNMMTNKEYCKSFLWGKGCKKIKECKK